MQRSWGPLLPWDIIEREARLRALDPALVAAIAQTESAGSIYVTRYEPQYRWVVSPADWALKTRVTLDTETVHQKTSWGLCQIMGAIAREFGFAGYHPQLCDPNLNLKYACQLLARLHAKYGPIEDVVASYNAGSPRFDDSGKYVNQSYVDKVMGLFERS